MNAYTPQDATVIRGNLTELLPYDLMGKVDIKQGPDSLIINVTGETAFQELCNVSPTLKQLSRSAPNSPTFSRKTGGTTALSDGHLGGRRRSNSATFTFAETDRDDVTAIEQELKAAAKRKTSPQPSRRDKSPVRIGTQAASVAAKPTAKRAARNGHEMLRIPLTCQLVNVYGQEGFTVKVTSRSKAPQHGFLITAPDGFEFAPSTSAGTAKKSLKIFTAVTDVTTVTERVQGKYTLQTARPVETVVATVEQPAPAQQPKAKRTPPATKRKPKEIALIEEAAGLLAASFRDCTVTFADDASTSDVVCYKIVANEGYTLSNTQQANSHASTVTIHIPVGELLTSSGTTTERHVSQAALRRYVDQYQAVSVEDAQLSAAISQRQAQIALLRNRLNVTEDTLISINGTTVFISPPKGHFFQDSDGNVMASIQGTYTDLLAQHNTTYSVITAEQAIAALFAANGYPGLVVTVTESSPCIVSVNPPQGSVFYSADEHGLAVQESFSGSMNTLDLPACQRIVDTVIEHNYRVGTPAQVMKALLLETDERFAKIKVKHNEEGTKVRLKLPEGYSHSNAKKHVYLNITPVGTFAERAVELVDGLTVVKKEEEADKRATGSSTATILQSSVNIDARDVVRVDSPTGSRRSRRGNGSNGKPKTKEDVKATTTATLLGAPQELTVDAKKAAILRTIQQDVQLSEWHGQRSWLGQKLGSTPDDRTLNDCPTSIVTLMGLLARCNLTDAASVDTFFTAVKAAVDSAATNRSWFRGKATQGSYDDYQRLMSDNLDVSKFTSHVKPR